MLSELQWVLFGFSFVFFVYLRSFKVPIKADNVTYTHHLTSLPSTIGNIFPVLFSQLFSKYGYESYLFKTEWGQKRILPNIITTIGPFNIDLNHLSKYLTCVGIDRSNYIPFGYFHCLCVKSLLFTLGKRREFPLKLLGSVHWKNTFKIFQYIYNKNDNKLFIETIVNKQIYFTKKHDLTFSVTHKIFIMKDDKDDKDIICSITDTYLIRAPKKFRKKMDKNNKINYYDIDYKGDIKKEEYEWNIKSSKSFNYSMISGDFNLIHLHKYTAKLFGFRSNIAHGMWSVAKIIDQILDEGNDYKITKEINIETVFERPLFLPNKTKLMIVKDAIDTQARFKLMDKRDKLVLQGCAVKT